MAECSACELRPRINVTFGGGIEKGVVIPGYIPSHVVLSQPTSFMSAYLLENWGPDNVFKRAVTEGSGQASQLLKAVQMSWGVFESCVCLPSQAHGG